MVISKLGISQAYDYFNTVGAQRDLTPSEQSFYDYCVEHHDEVCKYTMDEAMVQKANELYNYCVENRGIERLNQE